MVKSKNKIAIIVLTTFLGLIFVVSSTSAVFIKIPPPEPTKIKFTISGNVWSTYEMKYLEGASVKVYAGSVSAGNYIGSTTTYGTSGYFSFNYYCSYNPGVFSVSVSYNWHITKTKTVYSSSTKYPMGTIHLKQLPSNKYALLFSASNQMDSRYVNLDYIPSLESNAFDVINYYEDLRHSETGVVVEWDTVFEDLYSSLTPYDYVFVYISAHGNNNGQYSTIDLDSDGVVDMTSIALANTLDQYVKSKTDNVFVLVESCHAGFFKDHLAEKGISVITTSSHNTYAPRCDVISGDNSDIIMGPQGSENTIVSHGQGIFSKYFFAAVDNYVYPYYPSGSYGISEAFNWVINLVDYTLDVNDYSYTYPDELYLLPEYDWFKYWTVEDSKLIKFDNANDYTPITFASNHYLNDEIRSTDLLGDVWHLDTCGSNDYSYGFMSIYEQGVIANSDGELGITGWFRQFDILPLSALSGRRYFRIYILDSSDSTIITSRLILDHNFGTHWYLIKTKIYNLTPYETYRLAFGRSDSWSSDWELTVEWVGITIDVSD